MPPPAEHADKPLKYVRLIVSSADRNVNFDPTPASYTIDFDEPYSDVSMLTLLSANVPLVAYTVNANNDTLTFGTDNGEYIAKLPHGDTGPIGLAEKLGPLMTAESLETFEVAYDVAKDSFVIACTSSSEFYLDFNGGEVPYGPQYFNEKDGTFSGDKSLTYRANSPARLLGFGPRKYSSTNSTVKSEFRKDFDHTKTALVFIDGADVNQSTKDSTNKCFAVINPKKREYVPDLQIFKVFNPPNGKYSRMRIRLTDIYGNPYDTQNYDNVFEFRLTCIPRFQSKPNWTVRAD
jgi:hypothetical protein